MPAASSSKLVVACVLAAAAATVPGALAAGPSAVRLGAAPRLPTNASVLGALPNASPMHITVALKPRDAAALDAFVSAVSTPGSSEYRHYITPAQFAERFGATTAQIEAVQQSLRAHGLTPGPASANGLSIPVQATAGQLQTAFALSLERLLLPNSRTKAILNTVAPQLDANVAGLVQGVVGLSTLQAPRPLLQRRHPGARPVTHATRHVATGGPQPCAAARTAQPGQSAYTTDQIASAYGFSSFYGAHDIGAGQTIALYELEPYSAGDIAAYQSCYGTHAPISNVTVDGGAGSGPGAGEAALDIEQSIGLAPAANFLVYEGPNSNSGAPGAGPYDTWSAIVAQDRARVISASWGQCEPLEGNDNAVAEHTLFEEAAAQGQTITSATGDAGSEDCNGQTGLNPSLAVDDPSSQPFVTGVGGTTMSVIGPRPTEVVWNNGGGLAGLLGLQPGAGGGGESSFWGMPSYQSGAPSWMNVARSHARESPDVSADADPNTGYLIYWNGSGSAGVGQPVGWQGIGGTSAAAPVWASLIALANASRACAGADVGFADPALYRAAANGYGQDFNDVTSGSNDFTGTNGGRYTAGKYYDMASGLGTPNAGALNADLCQHATPTGSPKIARASLQGVRRSRPTLRMTVDSGSNAPAIARLAIRPLQGLHLAQKPGRVTITGPHGGKLRFTATVSHDVLTIDLLHPATSAAITIRYAAITATNREAAAVRRGHASALQILVEVADSHGHGTQLTTSVRPS